MQEGSRKAVLAAMCANGGIAVAKFVAFGMTGASSMLAEGVHSLADTGNQGLLLLGATRGQQGPSEEHPFGYGRERYFWAFVVALVIFVLGGVFAVYEGVHKLSAPADLRSPMIAVVVLLVGVVLEGWSFRTALAVANATRGEQSWWDFIRTTKAAELPVILLEDLGALVGLVLALVGVGLSVVTGDTRWDAVGSISIGVLLLVIASLLAFEMKSLLVGEAAAEHHEDAITSAIEAGPAVKRIIHLRTNHLAPDELLVAVKLELASHLTFRQVVDEINAAEARVRAAVPSVRHLFMEPDVYLDEYQRDPVVPDSSEPQ